MNMSAKMIFAAFGILLSISTAPVHAADGPPPIKGDACTGVVEKSRCQAYVADVKREWPKANKGDYFAIRRIALCFQSGCRDAVERNTVQACGWLLVALSMPSSGSSDSAVYRDTCTAIPASDNQAAVELGERLSKKILKRSLPVTLL
jgi:hypothetical protein